MKEVYVRTDPHLPEHNSNGRGNPKARHENRGEEGGGVSKLEGCLRITINISLLTNFFSLNRESNYTSSVVGTSDGKFTRRTA